MKKFFYIILLAAFTGPLFGQNFEQDQIDSIAFKKVKPVIGADFAVQFQGLNHSADSALIALGKGINLPTANFNISADLAPGIRVHLTTYLSSRHHSEAWVKDGYLLIDKLPFIHSAALDKIMDYTTIKVGVMELNYGDAHFRRSDNGNIIRNPFVGNYVMEAFTTAPGLEVMFRNNGLLVMAGLTSGSLKPALAGYSASAGYTAYNLAEELAVYFKAGYDKQFNEDVRLRATLSGYLTGNNHFGSLYYGDRTGSRYYLIMNTQTNSATDVDIASNHLSGNWGPGFTDELTSFMFNIFAQAYGFELFGTAEQATGTSAFGGAAFKYTQVAADLLYRFGKEDQFFAGGRYNVVNSDQDMGITRMQLGAGWFLTPDVVLKAEYVSQKYDNFLSKYGANAGFNGVMVEAGISF